MDVLKELKRYKSVSIIGNYKNVGKTTTLNYILNKAKGETTLGLTSIGIDGEEEDIVTKTHKPKIYVYKGSLIATAKNCALKSDITKEIIDVTNINTPLGKIIIFKALSDGFIELAGPSINSQIKYICNRLNQLGCDIAIVDGALSRKTMASPSITDATIFCTGAILSTDINKVVDKTVHEVNMMTIDKIEDDKFFNLYDTLKSLKENKVSIISKDYTYKYLNLKTTLNSHKEIIDNLDDNSKYILVDGIIVNSFIENIIKSSNKYKRKTFLITDATKIFLDKLVYDKFIRLGGNIKVINKINLIAISANPTSISGYSFDKYEFIKKLQEKIKVKVIDIK